MDILSYANFNPERLEVFDIGNILHGMKSTYRHKASQENISFQVQSPPLNTNIYSNAHKNLFKECLYNLINNAFLAFPKPPSSDAKVSVHISLIHNIVHIEIEDNSSGIPAEVPPRLFQPLMTTRERGEGTGVGLLSAKQYL